MPSAPLKDFATWWISPTTVFQDIPEWGYNSVAFKSLLEHFHKLICEIVPSFFIFYQLALGNLP